MLDSKRKKLLTDFYNYKYDRSKDVLANISMVQNIVYRLDGLQEKISDPALINKILSILPDLFKHFVTAWELTEPSKQTVENLRARINLEEDRYKTRDRNQERTIAFNASKNNFSKKKQEDWKNKQQRSDLSKSNRKKLLCDR